MDIFQNEEFCSVLEDNKSGSTELLLNLNRFFIDNFDSLIFDKIMLDKLFSHFSEFSAIKNYLSLLSDFDSREKLREFMLNFERNYSEKIFEIFHKFKTEVLGFDKFVTISNSFTILKMFQLLKKERNIGITVAESRPQLEGKIMAQKLAAADISVKFCTEAMLPGFIKISDCAVIGADKILPDGSIVNKVGSKLIGICCREYKKPLLVVSDKSKFTSENSFDVVKKSNSEIWDIRNDRIIIRNYYFEKLENAYISKIITN